MSEPLTDPGPSTPDDADWTWVLTRPCPDCGFAAAATEPAVEREYWRSDPAVVAREVTAAFEAAATAYALPSGTQWECPALRSNGSEFTARTLSLYFTHDIRHHLWDVNA